MFSDVLTLLLPPPVMVMFEGSMVDLSSLMARVRRADATLQQTETRMSQLQVSHPTVAGSRPGRAEFLFVVIMDEPRARKKNRA